MLRTGSLWPYRILAATVWHLRAARVSPRHVAAHEPKRCGPDSFRPTTFSFFIRGRRFPFFPHAFILASANLRAPHPNTLALCAAARRRAFRRTSAGARTRARAHLFCQDLTAPFFFNTGAQHGLLACFSARRRRRSPRQAPASRPAPRPSGSPPPLSGQFPRADSRPLLQRCS
jgi:hypothetical protein